MTELNEMSNTPIEISLNGRKLKARRPEIRALFAEVESEIISKEMEKTAKAAETYGLQGEEKTNFLNQQTSALPKGAVLQNLVYENLGTLNGVVKIFKAALKQNHPDIDDDEIIRMVQFDPELSGAWAVYLCGASKKAPSSESLTPEQ